MTDRTQDIIVAIVICAFIAYVFVDMNRII